ncbi:hypothetical protein NP233_g10788 [Leucocoprinus birnbaumii]|uniref:Uncharacterized protein n=1 Tax=Leucocoprinus birnbaumii TaxID=56174 RepID=A0AAD5VHK7_9AGAR|nr:hypothetical protein NP233_g10788 [Leucocoprinus birnbaumii]
MPLMHKLHQFWAECPSLLLPVDLETGMTKTMSSNPTMKTIGFVFKKLMMDLQTAMKVLQMAITVPRSGNDDGPPDGDNNGPPDGNNRDHQAQGNNGPLDGNDGPPEGNNNFDESSESDGPGLAHCHCRCSNYEDQLATVLKHFADTLDS